MRVGYTFRSCDFPTAVVPTANFRNSFTVPVVIPESPHFIRAADNSLGQTDVTRYVINSAMELSALFRLISIRISPSSFLPSLLASGCARLRNRVWSRNKSPLLSVADPIPTEGSDAPKARINTPPRKFAHLPSRVNEAIIARASTASRIFASLNGSR